MAVGLVILSLRQQQSCRLDNSNVWEGDMPYAREPYILYAFGGCFQRGKKGQKCIEKTSLFFEHKGTRIFETTKPLIKKKLHILCFLNYQPFFDEQNRRFPTQVLFERCMQVSTGSPSVSLRALTRNLILSPSNATRCVPTAAIGWDAGSCPARHGCCETLFRTPKSVSRKGTFSRYTLPSPWRQTVARNAKRKKLFKQ